ncbi:solute carrier family 22 member 13-like [Acanthochromis polyacanthus]|uniref:solute carrier family 22 member 13-like n=1 Tax=Acanthochromis polyacanthus TaxID=80966 RepID=UPI002233FCFA|nr:solute carrier family 22 member 13-like [Acanthochromis polyacanthus]
MSPLQLSVYWRLALIFLFSSFLFFLDILSDAVATDTCLHDNSSIVDPENNQSGSRDRFRRTESGNRDSVCGWTDVLSYGQTLYMSGLLLGSLVGGAISDRYGSRPTLLVFVCLHIVCSLVPAVLPQPLVFLAVRCLAGVCNSIINVSSFCLAVEWTLPSARVWPSAFLPFCFSLGTMGGALLAWLSPTWKQLHLSLAIPQLICLPLYLSIPESPRWLLLRRRKDVLERYRSNSTRDQRCLDQLLDSACSDLKKAQKEEPVTDHTPGDIITHLRHPTVLLRLIIMSYLSVASALTYYGICMNIGSFGVGIYSAQFFSGLSEAPCLLIPLVRLGRRPISMLTLFLSGAACFLSLLLSRYNSEPVLVMSLALMGKLCILATSSISILYCIELFPTVVRQRCVSLVNLSFRLGSLVNTLVPPSSNGAISLAAMLVYSGGPIIGSGLCLMLPETSDIPLPDSVEDCDRQPRPRPPGLDAHWWARKLWSSRTTKPENLPAEKDTLKQLTGLI